LFCWHYS